MRVDELLAGGTTTSFEFFPPKTDEEERVLERALKELASLDPSFVSVTYRGGAASRERTFNLVRRLHVDGALVPMAHLTCVHHTRDADGDVENAFPLLSRAASAKLERYWWKGLLTSAEGTSRGNQ